VNASDSKRLNVVSVDSDIIVVGAGPAGSFSALQAAKLGARVTLYEEHGEIGVPSHCTGHVSLAGINRLKLDLPEGIFENRIRAATFYSPSGYPFSIRFSSPVTCVINRRLFDQYLAQKAAEKGVELVHNARVDSLLIKKGSIRGVAVRRKRNAERVASRVVVDAEGVSSSLLKQAGVPSLDRHMTVNGVQAEVDRVDGIDSNTVEVFSGSAYAPGFFAWIVPKSDGTAKIGLGTARGNQRDLLRHFIRHHPVASQRIRQSRVTSLVYHPIPLGGPIARAFYNGLLIVGDAASHVKPTTGGGIVMGLTCARIAGKAAAYTVRCKNPSTFFLSEYERQWRKQISFDMAVMKRLRLMLSGFTDKQIDHLVAFCSQLGLGESLRGFGDTDFQGTSLVWMLRSPRFLATALYFLTASFL
jgi:digeranylgeranylglycerophospholipid reductase